MKSDRAIIHFETRRDNKTRWVRHAQRSGMKLADWIADTLDRRVAMEQRQTVQIPEDVNFSDLNMRRDSEGNVSFDLSPINRICEASGLDPDLFRDSRSNVGSLLVQWYSEHLARGGETDPVAEDLFAEALAEERQGQSFSYPPGRA